MLGTVVHESDRAALEAALADLLTGRADVRALEMRCLRAGGGAVWAQTSLVATGTAHGPRRVFAMIEDVTARKRKEALADGEREALLLLAQSRGLEAALNALLACLERNDPEGTCSILLCDDNGHLHHGAAPRLDDEFRHAFDGIDIGSYPRWSRTEDGRVRVHVRVTFEGPAPQSARVEEARDRLRAALTPDQLLEPDPAV